MTLRSLEDEVTEYSRVGREHYTGSALDWWKTFGGTYPRLCVLALHILAIQASSTSSERSFSYAGRLLPKSRASTSPLFLHDTLFVQQNDPHIKASREERRAKRRELVQRKRARMTSSRNQMSTDPSDADDETVTDLSD